MQDFYHQQNVVAPMLDVVPRHLGNMEDNILGPIVVGIVPYCFVQVTVPDLSDKGCQARWRRTLVMESLRKGSSKQAG